MNHKLCFGGCVAFIGKMYHTCVIYTMVAPGSITYPKCDTSTVQLVLTLYD